MFGYQKIKRKDFSWKWIFLFLLFMWIMTFVCRFISENGIPTVEVCRVEKNFVGESDVRYSLCVPLEAALEEGTITIADEIIAHSNMELENGSKVKLD